MRASGEMFLDCSSPTLRNGFQVPFGTTYLSLRVHNNNNSFSTPRGQNSYGSRATSKDASSWLLLALLGQAYPYLSVRIPACDGSTKGEIVYPLIIRTWEGGGTDVFDVDCPAQEAF